MNKFEIIFAVFLGLALPVFFASAAICPGGMSGSGISGDPCQVTSWTTLDAVRNELTLYYKLTTNLSSSTVGYTGIGDSWTPISGLSGVFDGDGKTISDLTINSSGANVGMFGRLAGSRWGSSGSILNVGLLNVNVTGNNQVGALVGYQDEYSSISNSYTTGTVTGSYAVGGLVGNAKGSISNCYSKATVRWDNITGGSYFGAAFGGLVGENYAAISNSYATGNVTGDHFVGGLVGRHIFGTGPGTITKCYSTGLVSGASGLGGLVGNSDASVTNSFWDIQTSGQAISAGGTGKTTAEMKTIHPFSTWDINTTVTDLNNGYPYLAWQASNNSYVWLIYQAPPATSGYAWSNNIGWINFGCANCNVQVTNSAVTGYAWSQNYGWINLNPTTSGVVNTSSGVLSGYAWGENTGWINFSGVRIGCSGTFSGTATGEVVGTVNFGCASCDVQTDWTYSCGGGGPVATCGDSSCNGAETCSTCPTDCGACAPVCGDGIKNGAEQCDGTDGVGVHQSCSVGCILINNPYCGDNIKNGLEVCDGDTVVCTTYGGYSGTKACIPDCSGYNGCFSNQSCGDTICNGTETCNNCSADCGACPGHLECQNQQCVFVNGSGNNLCSSNQDCLIFHNECNSESKCVSVSGPGSNTCSSDSQCSSVLTGGDGGQHTECNLKQQCVVVSGSGSNKCSADSDCTVQDTIINIISNPVDTAVQVVQIVADPVKAVAVETKKIIQSPQGSVTTKTISTAGLVITTAVTATSLFSVSLLELFTIPLRLFGILLAALGLKKRIIPWGVVYDSVTKRPLDPAYIVLKNQNGQNISSAVTDIDGRYGFMAPPGNYNIFVSKTNYSFPSQKLFGKIEDELHGDLYFGQNIEVKSLGEVIIKNIPLDPLKFDWNEFSKGSKKLMKFYSKWDVVLRKIYDWFFIVGFVVAMVTFIFAPYPYNAIVAIIYLVLILLRTLGLKPRVYGYITDKNTKEPLSFAIMRVVIPETNTVVASKPADKYGRYYCLVPPGKYYVKIEKKNIDGSYSLVYTSQVFNTSHTGIIKETFKI